jgi:glycosyltransferase involved in cell wall biosynthesis
MLDHIPADLVVYDVMDELANFKNAASDLREREAILLRQAGVVFTGGRSMYESRKDRHPNVHLFASGVDPNHFAAALDPQTRVAEEIAALPRPILGYYGVIDERLDLELLARLAAGHPEWSIVMVGPVSKVDPADLPRRPNIHYPGQQPYERLPHFLKGFDVCLMPFAMNEATRFISPTKTLEYMAAHKPIVSTPVPDVVANWSDVVRIAATPQEFAAAVLRSLGESRLERDCRRSFERSHLAASSWDHIAGQMSYHILSALRVPAG